MKSLIWILMLIWICNTKISFAATEHFSGGELAGNGGDVIFCKHGSPFKIKLLDFYEKGLYDPTFSIDLIGTNLNEKINYNLQKIERVSKVRSLNYKAEIDDFFDKVFWVKGSELVDIPDSNHLVIPRGCEIKQIAIQLSDNQIPGKKYIVNQDLWDLLSDEQKVGLIFHEIIYSEAIAQGHKDSVKVRALNSWIISKSFRPVSTKAFSEYMLSINFPTYQMIPNYNQLYLESLEKSYYNNYTYSGITSHNSFIPILGTMVEISKKTTVLFDENLKIGAICSGYFPNGFRTVYKGYSFELEQGPRDEVNYCIEFYPGSDIPKFISQSPYKTLMGFPTPIGPIDVYVGEKENWYCCGTISFHPNGEIKSIKIDKPTYFKFDGIDHIAKFFINFTETGLVEDYH